MSPPPSKKLQKALASVDASNLPGAKGTCPSCDKAGLSILVTLYAALPPQWYRPGESDWVQEAGMLDQNSYLASHPLKASLYVLRRLRAGWLYVYYPDGSPWEMYQVQADGRLLRMAPDLSKALGIGDVTCSRFAGSPETMLLTIEKPEKHPVAWVGFSDARWTQKVRAKAAKNPAKFHMKKIMPKAVSESTVAANMGPLQLIGRDVLKNQVLGFQHRADGRTLLNEAYARPAPLDETRIFDVMARNNAAHKIDGGIVLPLEDDIGIATQLNYYRNCALADIMGNTDGKGKAYTNAQRDKMVTAGLIDSTPWGDQTEKVMKHLDNAAYNSYLKKYQACKNASDDFDKRSADYVTWMKFLPTRGHPEAYDENDRDMAALLGHCVANLYEGCGLTNEEIDKILLPQLEKDSVDEQQLFWRGMAANQSPLLALMSAGTLGKASESGKQYIEVSEQLSYLKEVRELEADAMRLNAESAKRLMQTIASRTRELHKRNPKLYRQTFRRMQAAALTAEDEAILQVRIKGGPLDFLNHLRRINGDKGVSIGTPKTAYNRPLPGVAPAAGGKVMTKIPKTQAQLDEYFEVLGQQWPKGKPMPAELGRLAKVIGAEGAFPEHEVLALPKEHSIKGVKAYAGFSVALGLVRLSVLRHSVAELGVDVADAVNGHVEWNRLIKDISEATASSLGVIQAGCEVRYVWSQLANAGAKSTTYWRLFAVAGKLCFLVSIIEGIVGVQEARELWSSGDRVAGVAKASSAVLSVGSGAAYYFYTRMVASAALRAAGGAAEIAEGLALAGEAGVVGAEASVEVPPAAMLIGILSASLLVASWGAGWWADHMTTSVFEKWADRSLLGLHGSAGTKGDYGPAYGSTERQLDALLRIFYAIKVEQASAFSWTKSIEIKLPVFGEAAQIEADMLTSREGMIGRFSLRSAEWPEHAETMEFENLTRKIASKKIEGHAKREGDGITISFEFGDFAGLPTAVVRYWPNKAAYKDFMLDGRSAEEVAEAEAEEPEPPKAKAGVH